MIFDPARGEIPPTSGNRRLRGTGIRRAGGCSTRRQPSTSDCPSPGVIVAISSCSCARNARTNVTPPGVRLDAHRFAVSGIFYPLDQPPRDQRVGDALDVLASEGPLASDIRDRLRAVFGQELQNGASPRRNPVGANRRRTRARSAERAVVAVGPLRRWTQESPMPESSHLLLGRQSAIDDMYDVTMTSRMSINIEITGACRHIAEC